MTSKLKGLLKRSSGTETSAAASGESSSRPSLDQAGQLSFQSNNSGVSVSSKKSSRNPSPLKFPSASSLGGDFLNLTGKDKPRKPGTVCESCFKLDFEHFYNTELRDTDFVPQVLDLEDIISNKKGQNCNFCSLLFEAICAHDPFDHPAIKDSMPPKFKDKSFRTWAEGLNWSDKIPWKSHPFGRGRQTIQLDLDGKWSVDDSNSIQRDLVFAGQVAAANTAVYHAIEQSAKSENQDAARIFETIRGAIPAVATFLNRADNKLPVGVSVQTNNAPDGSGVGLFIVRVWGFGCGGKPSLSCLSAFNLRVAAPSSIEDTTSNLRYGNIINKRVRVKEDCRGWMEHCINNHGKDCENPAWFSWIPAPGGEHFRLLDVEHNRVVHLKSPPRYAALSYVWGQRGKETLNLHVENLTNLSESIDNRERNVAVTIRDALTTTKLLGIPYLWVDSLCNIQKDPNPKGSDDRLARQSQIDQMGSVFGHAQIVLVAAGGSDADAGLAGISRDRAPGQIAKEVIPGINVVVPIQYPQTYGEWDTRAWTLQEKLLAKRVLVFTKNHVSFHCPRGVMREDVPGVQAGNVPPPLMSLSPPEFPQDVLVKKMWNGAYALLRSPHFTEYARVLEQYTSRGITDPADVLNAVTGLFNALNAIRTKEKPDISERRMRPVIHIAAQLQAHSLYGIPESLLDLGLLWQPPASEKFHLVRRAGGAFPSWSWAGWEAPKEEVPKGKEKKEETNSHDHGSQSRLGVRYEEPFWVSSYDELSLRKILTTRPEAEERYRPLLMWYKWKKAKPPPPPGKKPTTTSQGKPSLRPKTPLGSSSASAGCEVPVRRNASPNSRVSNKPSLVPVNKNGLGIVFAEPDAAKFFLEQALKFVGNTETAPEIPDEVLKVHCLVCKSQVANFMAHNPPEAYRKEVLWKPKADIDSSPKTLKEHKNPSAQSQDSALEVAKELFISEAEIRDTRGSIVGYVIPTNRKQSVHLERFDFVLLSESQYWGNEERVDVDGFPLYNVMMVKWDPRGETATRVGLGEIHKIAWQEAKPVWRTVILV
ncbi:hypothetical protein CFIO01_04851 [Colletotrichum fioriniae PJ7]|uniref:Heterokaryon incompatibility domain-containing protein n=1 Tax=Colletotrichum fioriniae PJ7 TaxID=1445577 RepID=A0A010RTT7_9PEZI|nr:hypothetical protein CFIO01_04851 [Colletotrichum fioriniae PJ7]